MNAKDAGDRQRIGSEGRKAVFDVAERADILANSTNFHTNIFLLQLQRLVLHSLS